MLQPQLAANPSDAELAVTVRNLEARLEEIERELSEVSSEQFRLGVSHAAAILGRTVFQVAPWLGDWLALAVPAFGKDGLGPAITEIKAGWWMETHQMLEHQLVAFAALEQDLAAYRVEPAERPLTLAAQRAASPHLKLWHWAMTTLVEPPVHLLQAGRGRDGSGRLSAAEAWPRFLAALKTGLRSLLLSGRHPLYADCFGRELRELYSLSEEEFARWGFNVWVEVGGARFTNDECVESFAVLTLKEELGASFSEEAATRKQARLEAVDGVRRAVRLQTDGECVEAQRTEREQERHSVREPAIASALYRVLRERLQPVVVAELRAARPAAGRVVVVACCPMVDGTVRLTLRKPMAPAATPTAPPITPAGITWQGIRVWRLASQTS